MEEANGIQEIMGRSYGMPEIDDDELEAELGALGDEIALDTDSSYLDDAVFRAPNAPTGIPGARLCATPSRTNRVSGRFHEELVFCLLICEACPLY